MCGISGVIKKKDDKQLLGDIIRKVNGMMSHRGPDADGFFIEEGVALGHRRLSILDLSSAANQPFRDSSGRYVMVFNGEIYNFREIRRQLQEYPFQTSGDTEVVIAAYAKWGPACLSMLKGMFAIAIWDLQERTLFMARDRFGVKPLYYYQDDGVLVFASEIRAVLASGLVPRRLNKAAVGDFLKYQSFVAPLTPVENIFQLAAGSYMIWRDGKQEQKLYWDITDKREIEEHDPAGIHRKIRELLYAAVERRLVSDVPLGAFLSGGIDSSAVVAIMSQISPGATNAFTIGFEEKEYDEMPYAEMVARKYNVNHNKVLLKPEVFLEKLPDALAALDSPSGDGLNTYVVSHAIRNSGITVALSGIGGDELFAGYPMFNQYLRLKRRESIFDHSYGVRKIAAALMPATDQRLIRLKGLLSSPDSDISEIYPLFRQIHDAGTIRHLTSSLSGVNGGGTLEKLLRDKQEDIEQFDLLSQVSIADYLGYTQSVLLKDADQMGMAASLEIREPFFDHDLAEYVLAVPDKYKYPAYPKKLLVESLGKLLPDEVVFRKKQGFILPYDLWTRTALRSFCEDKIRRLAGRGYFLEKPLLQYWHNYLLGKANIRWADVWVFIVLEHWLEKNEVS